MPPEHCIIPGLALEPPCAARIVSDRVTELSERHDLPIENVSSKLPDVNRTDLRADCGRCLGEVTFTGRIIADECPDMTEESRSCEQSWISLHPETYLSEEGVLRTTETRCGAMSGRLICPAMFHLGQAKDGVVTAEMIEGTCIVDFAGRKFRKDKWRPFKTAALQVGLMFLAEDENGEAIIENPTDAIAPEQQDARPIRENSFGTYYAEIFGEDTPDPHHFHEPNE